MSTRQHLTKNFDALVVMGKRPSPGEGPIELEARTALAVLFWQQMKPPVKLICVEGHDLPDTGLSGAEVVRDTAVAAGVPTVCVVARSLTNCTAREVAAIREVLQELGANRPLAVTHPYHVRRTRWYLRELGITATVVGCSMEFAVQTFPFAEEPLRHLIERGDIHGFRYAREFIVEILLTILHSLDRRGRVEMVLADRIRGRMVDQTVEKLGQ